jgi:opacity protein-like surface antigen
MNRSVLTLSILFSLSGFAVAQAVPSAYHRPASQINIQGGGIFARAVTENGVRYQPTSAGSVDVGYRFYLTRWLGVEGDFDYFRNRQQYTTSTIVLSQKTNVLAVSGGAVFNLPNPLTKKFQSFFMVGGGALIFHPVNLDASFETKQAIVFGGGIDVPLGRHLAIRGQAKTFLYQAPDFGVSALKVDKFTQAMVPSAGIVWKF